MSETSDMSDLVETQGPMELDIIERRTRSVTARDMEKKIDDVEPVAKRTRTSLGVSRNTRKCDDQGKRSKKKKKQSRKRSRSRTPEREVNEGPVIGPDTVPRQEQHGTDANCTGRPHKARKGVG